MIPATGPEVPRLPHLPSDSFLAMVPPQVSRRMLQQGRRQEVRAGERIFIGEADAPLLVMRGVALLEQRTWSAATAVPSPMRIEGALTYLGPGDLSSEQHTTLLPDVVLPTLRMTFKTSGHVLRFARDNFRSIISMSPACTEALAGSVLVKYRRELVHRSLFVEKVPERLYRLLCLLAARFGTAKRVVEERHSIHLIEIGFDLTRQDMARLIASSESAVDDALKQLRDDGRVRTGYRRVALVDVWRPRQDN